MPQPLSGRTVALAEGRQLEELASLLEKEGADILRYPMLRMEDNPDEGNILTWLSKLIDGKLALLVLMTGEALRRLVAFSERAEKRDTTIEALGKIRILTRGPKPIQALKEIGLSASLSAKTPTTAGVIETLRDVPLDGETVGVTLYGHDHIPELEEFLESAGATVELVKPYVYEAAVDDARVIELVDRLASGSVDVLVITSTPQVDRLFEVAENRGCVSKLQEGLKQTKTAAIGPVAADSLRKRNARVDICPEQGFVMKNLVKQIVRAFE